VVHRRHLAGRIDRFGAVVSDVGGPPRTLRAEHVELTAVRDGDRERLFEWINDREEVILNAGYSPVHQRNHTAWFDEVRSRPDVVIFAIRAIADDELIGSCQLLNINRRHSSAELQIRIGARDARGKGYGTEAVRMLLVHAFRDLDLERVQLHVFATNERAIRVYEKAGLRREGVLRSAAFIDGERCDIVVMGILRGEADAT
jgi:RimJ/RimL family protein N-acetyltransferase